MGEVTHGYFTPCLGGKKLSKEETSENLMAKMEKKGAKKLEVPSKRGDLGEHWGGEARKLNGGAVS